MGEVLGTSGSLGKGPASEGAAASGSLLGDPYAARPGGVARRRSRRRRRLTRTLVVLVVLVVAVVVGAQSFGGHPGAGAPGGEHLHVGIPATSRVALASASAPAIPWASSGESAVAIPELGYAAQSGPEQPVAVASMTKIMTAYVILSDHPLQPGQQGPELTMTTADAEQFGLDTATDQANVEVQSGEVLSELQLLEGLLVHSANDLAYTLAVWDAGSVTAFVQKMNTVAAHLGMTETHFADASGNLPQSVSTAADLLKVSALAMANPVFASIVRMTSVTLPVAGTVVSYTPLLTTPGVVGVKSGFTTQAGGGDVLAYQATVGGRPVLALAAVTSQEGWTVLLHAGEADLAMAQAALSAVAPATVVTAGTRVGRATIGGRSVGLVAGATVVVPAMAGETVHAKVALSAHPHRGSVGTATFRVGGETASVPVMVATRSDRGPSA